jgi:hypothetical protein
MRAAQRQAPGRESTLAQFVPQLLVFIIHVRSPPRALPGWDLFFGPQGRVRAGAYRVFTNPGDLHEHLGELGLSAVP